MAKKKALPSPPPEADEQEETSVEESRDSEDGEEEEEEEESEQAVEEEGQKKRTTHIQPSQANKRPLVQNQTVPAPSAALSAQEKWGESDSPSSPTASDFMVKPISPARRASKETKPTSNRKSEVEEDAGKDSRSRKRANTNGGDEKGVKVTAGSASGAFLRVWREEDEIAVLEGMIDYQKSKGVNPSNDMAGFHAFIKGKLNGDMSKTQVYEKVRRLKNKFFANVEKSQRSGKDPVFSNAHESKAFELSKKFWGDGGKSGGGTSGIPKESEKKGVAKVDRIVKGGKEDDAGKIVKGNEKDIVGVDDLKGDDEDFASKYPHLSQSPDLDGLSFLPDGFRSNLKQNLSLINSVKAKELDEKWKKWGEMQAEFSFKKLSVMAEQTDLVLNAIKGGN